MVTTGCTGILRLARAYTRASLKTTGRESVAISSDIACYRKKPTADKRVLRQSFSDLHPISLSCKPCHLHASRVFESEFYNQSLEIDVGARVWRHKTEKVFADRSRR